MRRAVAFLAFGLVASLLSTTVPVTAQLGCYNAGQGPADFAACAYAIHDTGVYTFTRTEIDDVARAESLATRFTVGGDGRTITAAGASIDTIGDNPAGNTHAHAGAFCVDAYGDEVCEWGGAGAEVRTGAGSPAGQSVVGADLRCGDVFFSPDCSENQRASVGARIDPADAGHEATAERDGERVSACPGVVPGDCLPVLAVPPGG